MRINDGRPLVTKRSKLVGNGDTDDWCGKVVRHVAEQDSAGMARLIPEDDYERLLTAELSPEWAEFLLFHVKEGEAPTGFFEYLKEVIELASNSKEVD